MITELHKRVSYIVFLCVLGVALAMLAGCAQPTPTDSPEVVVEPPVEPSSGIVWEFNTDDGCSLAADSMSASLIEYAGDDSGYIPNQVIVTDFGGNHREILQIWEDFSVYNFVISSEESANYLAASNLWNYDSWEVSWRESGWINAQELLSITLPGNLQKNIYLYSLDEKSDTEQAVLDFNLFAYSITNTLGITSAEAPYAELNYVIQEPNGLEGLPKGESGGIVGAPAMPPFILDPAVDYSSDFQSQWAFQSHPGINLNLASVTGTAIHVAVFDTSPFAESGRAVYGDKSICVSALINEYGYPNPPSLLSEHGLFAASLIQQVAPTSDVHLIQILDNNAHGNLFSLLNALHLYRAKQVELIAPDAFVPTVVNLSLGFEFEGLNSLTTFADVEHDLVHRYICFELEDETEVCYREVVSLGALTGSYTDAYGYVFVAAAGNDTKNYPYQPASFADVLGVAANTNNGARACYSNYGEVAAPGGGWHDDETIADTLTMGSIYDVWASSERSDEQIGYASNGCTVPFEAVCYEHASVCEEHAILGMTYLEQSKPGYAYWAGTSFSAPFVSGLAALLAERHYGEYDEQTQGNFSRAIHEKITCSAQQGVNSVPAFGAGIINIQRAFSDDCQQ